MRLIINGFDIDLEEGTRIKQTKQTNDISSIETRQTNYTNSFNLPKTPNNVRAMDYLSLVGNTSNVPYQKNVAYLYSDTGECFVYKGWAIIKETTDVYKTYIQDGNLELYKAVENFLLSDLDLSELEHIKDIDTVPSSWVGKPYRYIMADYNGLATYKNGEGETVYNIDYLVPSVKVSYLWDKIFNTFGFTYSGTTFQTEEFQNLWMTYPKGINTGDDNETVFESDEINYIPQIVDVISDFPFGIAYRVAYYIGYESWSGSLGVGSNFVQINDAATYRIKVSGTLVEHPDQRNHPYGQILIGRNTENEEPNNVVPEGVLHNVEFDEPFEFETTLNLLQFDKITVVIKKDDNGGEKYRIDEDTSTINVEIIKINPNNPDFEEAFIDFGITDFLKEVVNHFGLQLFKNKYTNEYAFLTLKERLETAEVDDWTEKWDRKLSENYIYGDYAQQNILRHQYDDDKENYNDGSISIQNVNLKASKPLFESKVYTPLQTPLEYLNRQSLVYKLFDKQINDDGTVKYKSLSKRFHFIRSEQVTVLPDGVRLGSKEFGEEAVYLQVYAESYWKLSNKDVASQNYSAIRSILNNSKVVKITNALTEPDISQLDFRKLIYYAQEQSYFMLNKVNSYEPGKLTSVELVRIDRSQFNTFNPVISLGKGLRKKTVSVGDEVDIWVSNVVDIKNVESDVYELEKVSDYHYILVPDEVGTINLNLNVSKSVASKQTNTITIEVVE